jgi:hypothetical protein
MVKVDSGVGLPIVNVVESTPVLGSHTPYFSLDSSEQLNSYQYNCAKEEIKNKS